MYIRKGCNKNGFLSDRLGFFLFDFYFCQTPVLGLGLGQPSPKFCERNCTRGKGTRGRDKGKGIRDKG